MRAGDHEPVYPITAARPSLSADVQARTRRYLFSMGIRTGCFLLAVFTSGWLRWVFMAGALVLPYISVVMANVGRAPAQAMPAILGPTPAAIGPAGEQRPKTGDPPPA